jgi:hypothetical protein
MVRVGTSQVAGEELVKVRHINELRRPGRTMVGVGLQNLKLKNGSQGYHERILG